MRHLQQPTASVATALALLLLLALALAACGGSSDTASTSPSASPAAGLSQRPTPLPTPTVADTIVFGNVVRAGLKSDIYLVRADGTGLTALTESPGWEESPCWSPDGRRIAFVRARSVHGDGSRVWVMNADGSGQVKLTKNYSVAPSWSPDGTQIAFMRGGIVVMNADGSGVRRVTRPPGANGPAGEEGDDRFPTWAPDGKILFLRFPRMSAVPLVGSVFAVNPDGSGLERLTKGVGVDEFALSPDGKQLAIHNNTTHHIEVVPVHGGGTRLELFEPVFDFPEDRSFAPAWTPDGKALAVASCMSYGQYGSRLYVVNADGSGLSAVPGIENAVAPSWRPE